MVDQPAKLCLAHSHFVERFGRCVCVSPINRGPALPKKPKPPKFKPEPPQKQPHLASRDHKSQLHTAEKLRRYAISRGASAETAELVLRVAVFLRDGGRCQICGRIVQLAWFRLTTPPEDRFTLDHIVPLSRGGEHTYANIQSACEPCNSEKGNDSMAGSKEGAEKGAEKQRAQAKERQAQADRNATGKNPNNPGPPSEAWARKRGLIKDDED